MSIDHGKVLALAERVAGLAHMTLGKESREEREAIERELRALARPAEAVEGDPWIDDAPLPEGYRVEEFVPRRWYWCTQDAAGAWISDGTYYGSYAATVVAAWRDHSETLKQAPTDAAQGAVATHENIGRIIGAVRSRIESANKRHGNQWKQGGRTAINFIEKRLHRLFNRPAAKATHPQAAPAQGAVAIIERASDRYGGYLTHCDVTLRLYNGFVPEAGIQFYTCSAPVALRYFASGPEGSFFTDDLALARGLVNKYDPDGDWTITDLQNPTGDT